MFFSFHLAASRNQLFFMGQVSGQSYGLYSFNSTSSGSAPVLAAALDVPSTSMIREPMFAEFPSSNGIFFRGFPVGSSQPSIFMYDFTARSASPISFQTPQIGATPVDIYGPLQVLRVALGPATVGWIAHETNGTHQLLSTLLAPFISPPFHDINQFCFLSQLIAYITPLLLHRASAEPPWFRSHALRSGALRARVLSCICFLTRITSTFLE